MWRVWKFFQHCSFVTAWKLVSATEEEIASISQNFRLPRQTSEKITWIFKLFSNFWDNNLQQKKISSHGNEPPRLPCWFSMSNKHTVMYYILRKTERFCIYYVSCPLDLCKLQNLGLQNLSYEVGNLSFLDFVCSHRSESWAVNASRITAAQTDPTTPSSLC